MASKSSYLCRRYLLLWLLSCFQWKSSLFSLILNSIIRFWITTYDRKPKVKQEERILSPSLPYKSVSCSSGYRVSALYLYWWSNAWRTLEVEIRWKIELAWGLLLLNMLFARSWNCQRSFLTLFQCLFIGESLLRWFPYSYEWNLLNI